MQTGPLFEIINSMTEDQREKVLASLQIRAKDDSVRDGSKDIDQMLVDCQEAADYLEYFIDKFSSDSIVSLSDLILPTQH